MTIDPIYFKMGESDKVGFRLSDEKGPKDLSDVSLTIKFVIRLPDAAANTAKIMNCELGAWVKGTYYTSAQGGVTAIVTADATAAKGTFDSEILITDSDGNEVHWPSASETEPEYIPFIVHGSLNH
jgi:hypothetical protein